MESSKMTSVISVPANEGTSVKNEHYDTEINTMALKMNENASAAVKQNLAIVTTTTNNTQKNNQEKLHTDCEEVYSIKGRFSWQLIAGYHVPYIIRVINGEKLKFVSVRMVATQLLSNYLPYLHADIYTCISVRSHFITSVEAKLLNDINQYHSNLAFGNEKFFARKDYIVSLGDVREFYTFIEMCYNALLFNNNTVLKQKCGFICMNSESVVPYCIKDSQNYIPLFCFESETANLQHLTVKLENWNLAYLKFCCKVLGFINNEFFASDFCTVISLDNIKNFYSAETNFEEYWPPNIVDLQLLTNQNSNHVNRPGVWFKAPIEVVITEKSTIPRTLTESVSVLPQSMPVMINNQNRWPANQIDAELTQDSSLINDAVHVVSLLPLVHADNTAPVIGSQYVHCHLTNTQLHTLNNVETIVPPTIQLHLNFVWKLTKIPERLWKPNTNTAAYKIQKVPLQGRMIYCINANPYKYLELMVTLDDLVQMVLPSFTVERCVYILQKILKTTLFCGNSEQLALLRENGRLRSTFPEGTPMAMLQDIKHVLIQLKILMDMRDDELQQYQSAGEPSKRHRTI